MKRNTVMLLLLTAAVSVASMGCSSSDSSSDTEETTETAETETEEETETESSDSTELTSSDYFTERDLEQDWDESEAVEVTLLGDSASCDEEGVSIDGGTITITDEGTYVFSGTLNDGMIIVEVEDTDKVQIVLNGVDITSSSSAAIYVKQADKVFITTAENTTNTLSNGGSYVNIDDNNIDAVIFAKDDITLNGKGSLVINASAIGHGIVSKDDLKITGGTYEINASEHGLSGKDSVRIAAGTINITCGEDAIHADNDEDDTKGYCYICGGTITIAAGDDGIHASSDLIIDDGDIDITESYEGLEGLAVYVNGGTIDLVASDDGINAAGGTDESQYGAGGGGDMFATTDGALISINGGTLNIDATGDGIDSNGDVEVTGGTTYVSGPTNDGNGALDYNGSATISGGIFVATGTTGMAQTFGSDSTQGSIMIASSGSEGSTITLTDSDGNEILSQTAGKTYTCVIVSCPEITDGETYTLTADGSSSEITMDGLVYSSVSGTMGGGGGQMGGGNMGGGQMQPGGGGGMGGGMR